MLFALTIVAVLSTSNYDHFRFPYHYVSSMRGNFIEDVLLWVLILKRTHLAYPDHEELVASRESSVNVVVDMLTGKLLSFSKEKIFPLSGELEEMIKSVTLMQMTSFKRILETEL